MAMKPEEQWTPTDYWNDLQKGDLEVETYIRVGDELAEYAAQLEEENERVQKGIQNILSQLRSPRTETTSLRRALNALLAEESE